MIREKGFILQIILVVFIGILAWQNYLLRYRVEYLTKTVIKDNRDIVENIQATNEYMMRILYKDLHTVDTVFYKK
jgi:hypothetical protein